MILHIKIRREKHMEHVLWIAIGAACLCAAIAIYYGTKKKTK